MPSHSSLIHSWTAPHESILSSSVLAEDTAYRLKSPHGGYPVQIVFTDLRDSPDRMVVRSFNGVYEDETRGIYGRAACSKFYEQLTAAGFVAF
jgi:hypothetical protein